MHSNASLTGYHVVRVNCSELESGTFPIGQLFQQPMELQRFTETEEMMEQSI